MYKVILFLCIRFTILTPIFYSANTQHAFQGFKESVQDSSHSKTLSQELFNHYYDQTFNQLDSNRFDLALLAIAYSEEQAWKSGDSSKIIKAGRVKVQVLNKLSRDIQAICVAQEILPIAFRNRKLNETYLTEYAYLLNSISISYTYSANYSKALEFGFNSLALAESMDNKDLILTRLNNIGLIYYKFNNYEKAIEYYKKTLLLSTELGELGELVQRVNINLGLCYIYKNMFQDAEKYVQAGMGLCDKICSDDIQMEGNFALGATFLGMKRFNDAFRYYKKSLALAIKINNPRFQAENLLGLGRVALAKNQYKLAALNLAQSESIAQQHGYLGILLNNYIYRSELSGKTVDFVSKSAYQEKYIVLKDSLYSEELIQSISELTSKFEERINLTIIQEQHAISELQKEIIGWQRLRNLWVSLALIILFALIVLLYYMYTKKVKFEIILEQKIKNRTQDLETSRINLQLYIQEQDNFIDRMYQDTAAVLANLKGIYHTASLEVKDPLSREYLLQVKDIIIRLKNSHELFFKKTQSSKDLYF